MTGSGQIALAVAERLLDPAAVVSAVADAASLTCGLAGTALLHARLAAVDPVFADAAESHWRAAAARLKTRTGGFCGIQAGQGGLAASLIVGTTYLPDPEPLRDPTARAAAWLSACAVDIADQHAARPRGTAPPWHVYDAVTGLAGVGRALLAARQSGLPGVEPGLHSSLTALTAILTPREGTRPGWHLPADAHPHTVTVHPSGAATTGMAHGVAGPLALLSTAHSSGCTVPGQLEAIRHAADWLLRWQHDDGRWPPYVTGEELDNNTPPSTPGRGDAWCYGTPGIARALALADQALDDRSLTNAATSALESMTDRTAAEWDVAGPTLCHGHAGVAQSALAGTPLAEAAATAVVDAFDPDTRFGFQHRDHGHVRDQPGLLTGAAGAALALADHTGLPAPTRPISWDCLLNLS
ncbi:MAG: lanthionine synthetase C family protein [Stackebrandtia sp.]